MANPWDKAYSQYFNQLRSGEVTADFIREIYGPLGGKSEQGNSFADRVIAIHQELLDQQQRAGGKIPIAGGSIGKDDAVWDMAFRLAETGTDSLYDLGQRQVEQITHDGEAGDTISLVTELYHKPTDAAVDFKRSSSGTDLNYNLQFSPDGMPVMFTQPKPSDWMEFREGFLRPVVNMAAPFIPGAGPYIAAANAAYAASKGDWERALLSGLSAAVPLAGKFGAGAETVGTLNNVRQAANVLKTLESKDLLGLAMSGANLAGVTELGGYSIKDVNQAVGMVKALQSEDPMAIVQAGMGYLPKGNMVGFDSKDLIEGYFLPGGEGYYDTDAENAKLTGPGYYDEFTGRYIQDPLGGMQGPLDNTSGTRDPRLPWEYNQVSKDVWEDDKGNRIDLSYIPSSQQTLSGDDIMNSAGATVPGKPATPSKAPPPKAPPKPGTPSSGMDINQLMSLLNSQQAAPTIVSSGQENAADVQLMENIFGTDLSAPPAGDLNAQTRELARLLRS